MAEQIGQALARVANPRETGSTKLSTVDWSGVDLTVLNNLPARLGDRQLAAIDQIARLPVPVPPPAEEDFFLQCMRTIRLLPGRSDDATSGELRLNLYRRHFGRLSRDQLAYLTDRVTATCKWFPTPAEMFDILKGFERRDAPYRASRLARAVGQREWQARFDDTMRRFKAGEVDQSEVEAAQGRLLEEGRQGQARDDQDDDAPAGRQQHQPSGQRPASDTRKPGRLHSVSSPGSGTRR